MTASSGCTNQYLFTAELDLSVLASLARQYYMMHIDLLSPSTSIHVVCGGLCTFLLLSQYIQIYMHVYIQRGFVESPSDYPVGLNSLRERNNTRIYSWISASYMYILASVLSICVKTGWKFKSSSHI